jgi:hypothetical protein
MEVSMRRLHRIGLIALLATLAMPVATASAQSRSYGPGRPVPAPAPRGSWELQTRNPVAFDTGFRDGYAEGLNDGRRRHRNDPFAESRYRSADHGFDWRLGSREAYRFHYRDGFESGYERGFREGWRRW